MKNKRLRCSVCGELYDPSGVYASKHNHHEPQSGIFRSIWLRSGLSYKEWVASTKVGHQWLTRGIDRERL